MPKMLSLDLFQVQKVHGAGLDVQVPNSLPCPKSLCYLVNTAASLELIKADAFFLRGRKSNPKFEHLDLYTAVSLWELNPVC